MGKKKRHWRKYQSGPFHLGKLNGRAIAYWYEEIDGKKRKRRYKLDAFNETSARAALDQFASENQELAKKIDYTVGEVYELYLADREEDGKQTQNLQDRWARLSPYFVDLKTRYVSKKICRRFASELFEEGVSQSTVWTYLTQLSTILNWGISNRLYPAMMAGVVWKPSKSPSRDRIVEQWEVAAFLAARPVPHIRLFFILALTTGARLTAILELTWDRVDFEKQEINFVRPENIDFMKKVVKKGRATVLMTELNYAALHEAKEAALSEYVIEYNGRPVASIKTSFNTTCKRAGIQNLRPHDLRHSLATLAYEDKTVPVKAIQHMLGHKDIKTTIRHYVKIRPRSLQPVTDMADQIFTGKTIDHDQSDFIAQIIKKYNMDEKDAKLLAQIAQNSRGVTIFEDGEV